VRVGLGVGVLLGAGVSVTVPLAVAAGLTGGAAQAERRRTAARNEV
jgi:hypothetical protein